MLVVITYDVRENRRRLRVANRCHAVAQRVQKSVFEGFFEPQTLRRLVRNLDRTIDPQTDSVRVYPLCDRCCAQILVLGTGRPFEEPDHLIL